MCVCVCVCFFFLPYVSLGSISNQNVFLYETRVNPNVSLNGKLLCLRHMSDWVAFQSETPVCLNTCLFRAILCSNLDLEHVILERRPGIYICLGDMPFCLRVCFERRLSGQFSTFLTETLVCLRCN